MTKFEFTSANQIIFGNGVVKELEQVVKDHSRVYLVHGPDLINADHVIGILTQKQCELKSFIVPHEPTLELIQESVEKARPFEPGWVISVGGGSAIDVGKATTALVMNPGMILDYLEVVGRGLPLQNPGLPMIAIPTTAGTGSEVTRNAVLSIPEKKVKVSLRSPYLLPRLALVDPELTLTMPPALTASTGMDALAQVLEPFVCNRSNPLTDLFCQEGIQRATRSLTRAYRDGNELNAREDMAMASLLGGLALANAGLGVVHGFAAAIGGMYDAPHGAICAQLLPAVVRINVGALRNREPLNPSLKRYETVCRWLTQNENAAIEDGISWLQNLLVVLNIPTLRSYGISENDVPVLVANAAAASSTRANPIKLTDQELTEILTAAL